MTSEPVPGPAADPQVRSQQCFWIECQVCGTDSFEEGVPHFDTPAQAWAFLLGADGIGWTVRADGRVLCRGHSERADCAEDGHLWAPWRTDHSDAEVEWRYCEHCGGAFEDRLVALGWPP